MPRGPSRPYPGISLLEAARLAEKIREKNPKRCNRILLAEALGMSPGSSGFRDLISASLRYGFTIGNFNSEAIALTELGEQLTKPRSGDERLEALRKGMRNIPLFEKLLQQLNNKALPTEDFLKNTIERPPFDVPFERSKEASHLFIENGQAVGFIRDVGGSLYVTLEAGPPLEVIYQDISMPKVEETYRAAHIQPTSTLESTKDSEVQEDTLRDVRQPSSALQFFVAHGHDKDAVDQVTRILAGFSIPYMVAVEEPNAGRPISQKVKDLMDACTGGIFIFSADEEFKNKEGNTIFRPRENVIYELGAASYLYGQRIVLFKEKSVTFPTDFRDLGYIEFEKGQLEGKTMELLKELLALKAIKISPGS